MSTSHHRIPRNVIALGFVSLFTDVATEMIYPLLPIFITILGSGAIMLGIIEGVAETTSSLLKFVSGYISDKTGKQKPMIVFGYALSSFLRPLMGLATSGWQIVAIRMSDRIGKGVRTVPRDSLIALSTPEQIRGKAFGFHRAMDHTGAVLGPLLSVFTLAALIIFLGITELSTLLRITFLMAILPGLLAMGTLILYVRNQNAGADHQKNLSFSLKDFNKNFRKYLGVIALFALGNSSDAFMLFRIQETFKESDILQDLILGNPLMQSLTASISDPELGKTISGVFLLPLIWAYFHIIKAILSTPLGSLSDRIGRKVVINIGWGIYAAVYVGFAILDQFPDGWQIAVAFLLFSLYAVYYAFTEGAEKALIADLVPPHLSGRAFGLYHFSIGMVALPASVLFGIIYSLLGASFAFSFGAAIALAAMTLLAFGISAKPIAAESE